MVRWDGHEPTIWRAVWSISFRAYSLLGIDCISLMQRSISCWSKPKSWTKVRHDQAMWTTTTWKVLRCRLVGEQHLRWKSRAEMGDSPTAPYWISCSNQMWRGSKNEVTGAFCRKEAKCAFTKNDVTRIMYMSFRDDIRSDKSWSNNQIDTFSHTQHHKTYRSRLLIHLRYIIQCFIWLTWDLFIFRSITVQRFNLIDQALTYTKHLEGICRSLSLHEASINQMSQWCSCSRLDH